MMNEHTKAEFIQLQNQLVEAHFEIIELKRKLAHKENEFPKLKETSTNNLHDMVGSLKHESAQNELAQVKLEKYDLENRLKMLEIHLEQNKFELETFKKKSAEQECMVLLLQRQISLFEEQLKALDELESYKKVADTCQSQLAQTELELAKLKEESTAKEIFLKNELAKKHQLLIKSSAEKETLKNKLAQAQCELQQFKDKSIEKETSLQNQLAETQLNLQLLNRESVDREALKIQLASTQLELLHFKETVSVQLKNEIEKSEVIRKELNDTLVLLKRETAAKELVCKCIASAEKQLLEHKMISEAALKDIQTLLLNKLGFTDKNGEFYTKSLENHNSNSVALSIQNLIKDKVQLIKDSIPKLNVTESEIHLVVSIANFLKNVSFSISTDFFYSFVKQIDNSISKQDMINLLHKFPSIFKKETVGFMEKWRYSELKPIISI